MNNTLYLFRHGLATISTTGYGSEIKTADLLPTGIEQAQKIGRYLQTISPDLFYSSEYPRCQQTANIVANSIHHPYKTDARLNEYHEVSFVVFVEQIRSFLEDLSHKNNQHIFICTHVATIVVIKKILAGEHVYEKELFTNIPLPGVIQIVNDISLQEIDLNRIL